MLSGDTIRFIGGTNVTTSYDTVSNELTINSTDQFQGTVTSVATTHAGNAFTASIGGLATVNPSVDITMNGSSVEYVDGAGNLQTFPAIPQGDVTDVEGGNYITTVNSTGPIVTVDHDPTNRSDNTSTVTTAAGDTVTAVDSVTTNTTGHVTGLNLKSITLPTASESSETIDIQVKNISSANGGINLVKGDPVYIYGSVGSSPRLYVDLADADSTVTNNLGDGKMPCVALLDQDLSPNGEGTATVVGKLRNLITSPIDGATPSENDTIYVKSGGGLTLTKPTGSTNLIQNVGQVGRVSTSNNGNIVVAALLRSNDVPNLPEGRIWIGDGNTIVSDTVYVDEPNNRVGIGTAFPQSQLHLEENTSNAMLTLKSTTGGDDNSFIRFYEENNGATYSVGLNRSDAQFRIAYDTDGNSLAINPRFVINNTGNVGIGTTTPTSKLHSVTTQSGPVDYTNRAAVLGINDSTDTFYANSVGVAGKVSTSGGFAIYGDASGAGGWAGYFDGKGYFSGNVGIGTTSPSYKLDVNGSIASSVSSGFPELRLSDAVSDFLITTNSNGDGIIKTEGTSKNIRFFNNSGETMRISGVGNVGIATTSPSYKLDVAGTGRFTDILRSDKFLQIPVAGTTVNEGKGVGLSLTDDFPYVGNDSTTRYLNHYGMGIHKPLQASISGGNGAYLSGYFGVDIFTSGNSRIHVNQNGNVGIGTTNPTQKLDVNGNIETSFLYLNNGTSLYLGPAVFGTRVQISSSGGLNVIQGSTYKPVYASAFNVSSDYRLKSNIEKLESGIDRLKQLPVYRFNWNDRLEEDKVDGFLAHELSNVIPESVDGEKDGLDQEGNPLYQSIDQSKIVPLLTAALQESIEKIEKLEQRIQILENK